MKLYLSLFLMTLTAAPHALGFTGPSTNIPKSGTNGAAVTSTRVPTKLHAGFISNIFKDRGEDDGSWFVRFKKPVVNDMLKDGMDLSEVSVEEEQGQWEIKADGIFGYIATKDMTGVEPYMTQLCATVSNQLYNYYTAEEFKLSTNDHKTEVVIYDNHGEKLKDATAPFIVTVSGDKMIIGWRGSNTMSDFLNDGAASPQSSFAWKKHSKTIKAQGAFTSIVTNDIVTHEEDIIREAKKRGIKEIITTGHSLGGGCAQVGHLILRAQIEDEKSIWSELKGVNVRSVCFSAPMTTVIIDNASDETDAFYEQLSENSCNFIYANDIVPRGYGYLNFCEDFIEDAARYGAKNIKIPWALKRLLGVKEKMENIVDTAKGNDMVKGFLVFCSEYRHVGAVIHYDSEDAKPRVLKDMGAFYKNTAGDKDVLRDVKYVMGENPIEKMMDWHCGIIRNPGLAYPPDKLC